MRARLALASGCMSVEEVFGSSGETLRSRVFGAGEALRGRPARFARPMDGSMPAYAPIRDLCTTDEINLVS